MFNNSLIAGSSGQGGSATGFYDHPIEQSLRFNDDDSAYLSRTPSSESNRKTFTWSGWVKRGNLASSRMTLFSSDNGSYSNWTGLLLEGEKIRFLHYVSTVKSLDRQTTAVFRDTSAWYHIVIAFDMTQATASNRQRLYVNGVEITDWSNTTTLAQNSDTWINYTQAHNIGKDTYLNEYLDGYMAEVHFIDGTALDASYFGETKSGVWIPKAYSGSYGTNGFYLDFDGTYYNDKSGNGNNFTANNLAATDVVLDSPTNNFATINLLSKNPDRGILSEGNLKNVGTDSNWAGYISSIGVSSGKWYAEFIFSGSGGTDINVGVQSEAGVFYMDDTDHYLGKQSVNYGYFANGNKVNSATQSAYGSTFTNGDVMGVALDMDAGTIVFYKNNVSQGTAFTGLSGLHFIGFSSYRTGYANFGQDSSFAGNKTAQGNTDANGYGDFYYAPPTGYLALCTANLTVPDAMNPALDASPQDYFNTVLYTANNSTAQSITGVGFQPDFLWFKQRNRADEHVLFDSIRGAGKYLRSDTTAAEGTDATGLTSFDADGFSLGTDGATWLNYQSDSMVAWNWKANGSGVSNTDGSITSTVSANTDAGFSIVTYTGNKTAGASIGHGLNSAPEMIICKNRSAAEGWPVYTKTVGPGAILALQTNNATYSNTNFFNNQSPTASVFYVGSDDTVNASGSNQLAYCFHSVEGFSRCGSYVGSGSADGPMIYMGFTPKLWLVKCTSAAGESWMLMDSERHPYNVNDSQLYANLSNAEANDGNGIDFVSNGIKIRSAIGNWNLSGGTYIYMAFAENPFKYSTAR